MNKLAKLFLILTIASISAQRMAAQVYNVPKPVDTEWVAKPKLHNLAKEYMKEMAVVLTQRDDYEYKFEGKGNSSFAYSDALKVDYEYKFEGAEISVYHTYHQIVKILDDRGIHRYSTVSIPFHHSAHIQELKARTISPSGKVYDIPDFMFKMSRDESGAPCIIFAMEGVEKDAEVEVYMKELRDYSTFDHQFFNQDIPILKYEFVMGFPKELKMELRGYNGFPDAKDTLITGRRHLKVSLKNIPALQPEPFSYIYLHLLKAEWRMSYYTNDVGKERQFTWDEFAKQMYKLAFHFTDSERLAVNNFLSSIGITGSERELDKIIKIEKGIKENIILYPATEFKTVNLDTVISKKSATYIGYLKLYACCFSQTDVKCELGATTNKEYHKFNQTWEMWDNLAEYIIYFPHQKEYLAPTHLMLRYPMLPIGSLANYGVFCKMSTPAEPRPRVGDIKFLPSPPAKDNFTNIDANVTFGKNMEPQLDIKYTFGGYEAVPMRTKFSEILNVDKRKDMVVDIIPVVENQQDLVKWALANEDINDYFSKKPFEISATLKAPQMMEKAGSRYLFKIGELIGKQAQIYEAKKRKMPVDFEYPHSANHTFTINLPAGMRVLDPQSLRKKVEYFDAANRKVPACSFVTNYTIKGSKLIVTVNEIYAQNHYHFNDFETFRQVINAAADFNKVEIVIGR